jgi:hypothetical protein
VKYVTLTLELFFKQQVLLKTRGLCWHPKMVPSRPSWVWPVWSVLSCSRFGKGHTGLTGGLDQSDRSTLSPSRIEKSWCFSSCKGLPCGARPPHPINIKGHDRLRTYHPIDQSMLQLLPPKTLAFPTPLLFLFVSMVFKDVPLTGETSQDKSFGEFGISTAARSSAFVCWPVKASTNLPCTVAWFVRPPVIL